MKVVQFYPDRIVTTMKRDIPAQPSLDAIACKHLSNKKTRNLVKDYPFDVRLKNLKVKKSTGELSKSSKRQIRDSITSLVMLSKPRTIQLSHKKFIYNYRASFVTLKLPAPQEHSDVDIKKCLNLFLNNLRAVIDIKNYVWKAELQKNENIHFHLVLDKFVNYHSLLYYWNKAINSLGYVDKYSDKFMQMSYHEYAAYRTAQDLKYGNDIPPDKYRNAFQAGKSSKWQRPNSVSVNNVRTDGQVAHYLAKYLGKSSDDKSDPERFEKFGKCWARSRSLSALKYQNKFDLQDIKDWLKELKTSCCEAVAERYYDYCSIIYINLKKLDKRFSRFIQSVIWNNSELYNYPHPT